MQRALALAVAVLAAGCLTAPAASPPEPTSATAAGSTANEASLRTEPPPPPYEVSWSQPRSDEPLVVRIKSDAPGARFGCLAWRTASFHPFQPNGGTFAMAAIEVDNGVFECSLWAAPGSPFTYLVVDVEWQGWAFLSPLFVIPMEDVPTPPLLVNPIQNFESTTDDWNISVAFDTTSPYNDVFRPHEIKVFLAAISPPPAASALAAPIVLTWDTPFHASGTVDLREVGAVSSRGYPENPAVAVHFYELRDAAGGIMVSEAIVTRHG